MIWKIKSFPELTPYELYDILNLRSEIFVVEQNCVYQDLDYHDQHALHICGYEDNQLVAYGRIKPSHSKYDEVSFGRIVVKEEYRNRKLGKLLIHVILQAIFTHYPEQKIVIEAQSYLLRFYESFGFQKYGDEFMLDGIPHWMMTLEPALE